MNLDHGGHLTHGSPVNFSGKLYKIVPYGVRQDNETIDYDELRRLAQRAPAEADPVRRHGLLARHRLRALPRDRRRGGRGAVRRHRAHRGPRRDGPSPEPGRPRPADRHHHAQDAARAARRHDPVRSRVREGDRLGGVPGRAGRSAHARDRRQGGGVPRGAAAGLPRLLRADRGERARARGGARRARLPDRVGRHRQPPVPALAGRPRAVRQGGASTRSSRPASPRTRTWCPSTRASPR